MSPSAPGRNDPCPCGSGRTFNIGTACRSPPSAFVVEQATTGRSLDLKDMLTGKRFHVLEQGASQRLRLADLLFTRVVTLDGASIMTGASPFIVPPRWHTRIIDWRERLFRKRLMTRQDLDDFEIEIGDMYFEIAAELLDPTPPQLSNTDGDPLALTTLTFTLTYDVTTTVQEAFEKLSPLARVRGEEHIDDMTRDASGAVTSASLTWVRAGNRQHKNWDNTILGSLRLAPGRLVADVNSARRAGRLRREIAKCLPDAAILVDTKMVDPAEAIAERQRQRTSGDRHGEPAHETSAALPPDRRRDDPPALEGLARHTRAGVGEQDGTSSGTNSRRSGTARGAARGVRSRRRRRTTEDDRNY